MIYPALELVRLAYPEAVYTDRHMDMVFALSEISRERKDQIRGLKVVYEAPVAQAFYYGV